MHAVFIFYILTTKLLNLSGVFGFSEGESKNVVIETKPASSGVQFLE